MQENDEQSATPDERLDAIETLLGHLIFLMEAEPNFTAEALVDWIALCRERERHQGIAHARSQVVFAQLCERLQLVEGSQPEADEAAKQAARFALRQYRNPPAA